jgi:glycosyltransferase involved in cell wall biosynthesis
MVHANLLARIGRLFVPGIPVVCTVHSLVEAREGSGETVESRLREVAYRATDRLASATTAVSAAAAARYIEVRAVPQNRMIHIPNGFDFSRATPRGHARAAIRRELGIRDDEFLWTTVGRLVAEKGHSSLLEAFDRIRKGRPDVRLVIVGDGPEKAALERLSSELRLGGDALLLGMRTDVASILDAADAFVLSSEVEGLPMVLLEAAAQRLPIVSTDVGGCREVARPELGAILVTPGPEGLARGMMAVMEMTDPERASIGEALRRHVQSEYDQGAILQRWEQVYASVAPSLDGA